MAISLLFTGFSFYIPSTSDARIACIALGIYLFGVVYSPGEGPVPFTYSAEAYPLYVRTVGMSLATSTTWFFNFVLSITWLSLQAAFKPQGAFGWYAAWNLIGWVLVLLFMPVRMTLIVPIQLNGVLIENCNRKLKARRSRNSTRSSPCQRTSTPHTDYAKYRTSSRDISSVATCGLNACMSGSR